MARMLSVDAETIKKPEHQNMSAVEQPEANSSSAAIEEESRWAGQTNQNEMKSPNWRLMGLGRTKIIILI